MDFALYDTEVEGVDSGDSAKTHCQVFDFKKRPGFTGDGHTPSFRIGPTRLNRHVKRPRGMNKIAITMIKPLTTKRKS